MNQEWLNDLKKEEKESFSGWDFSYIHKRIINPKLPWDYLKIAKKLVKKSTSVLDMETGGGEVFSSFAPFPNHAVAYEGYKPNVSIAKKKLKPLGVKVVEVNKIDSLPFREEEFDLILNRHGAVNAKETYRILKKGGTFLTQQVTGSEDLQDLVKEFKAHRKFSNITLEKYLNELKKAGFKIIIAKKHKGKLRFKDVGAIVYYLRAIPWIVEGFSVNTHLPYLENLQNKLIKNKKLEFDTARFLILAKKE